MPARSSAPNIVFVHVDQMRHDAIAALGNPHLHTPQIDRILADGTFFGLSHSANPVCCPARASWYTGRVSTEHGVVQNSLPLLESVPDLGQWMGKRGYACYYTGKWHVPNRRLDRSFTVLPGGSGHGERGDAGVAGAAAGFLSHYDGNLPFFLNVGFLNPHDCCFLTFAPESPSTKFGSVGLLRDELPPAPANFDTRAGMTSAEGGHWDETGVRLDNYSTITVWWKWWTPRWDGSMRPCGIRLMPTTRFSSSPPTTAKWAEATACSRRASSMVPPCACR